MPLHCRRWRRLRCGPLQGIESWRFCKGRLAAAGTIASRWPVRRPTGARCADGEKPCLVPCCCVGFYLGWTLEPKETAAEFTTQHIGKTRNAEAGIAAHLHRLDWQRFACVVTRRVALASILPHAACFTRKSAESDSLTLTASSRRSLPAASCSLWRSELCSHSQVHERERARSSRSRCWNQ